MIIIKKYETKIKKLYTFFEFVPCNSWEDFEVFRFIFKERLGYEIENEFEAIYARSCIFKKNDFTFELFFHDDYGNCIANPKKQSKEYYKKLEELANEIAEGVATNRFELQGMSWSEIQKETSSQ